MGQQQHRSDHGSIDYFLISIILGIFTLSSAYDAPHITHKPKELIKVRDEGMVYLFCKASGNPVPNTHWRRNGRRIGAYGRRSQVTDTRHGSVLLIEPVRAKLDDGLFECVADNGIGESAIASSRLEIYPADDIPSGYPRVIESPHLKAVEKGHDTVMLCSASGNPEPTITWLKDLIPVNLTDPRLHLLSSGSLEIRHSQLSDEGTYECKAETEIGVSYSYPGKLYVRTRRVEYSFDGQNQ